MFSSVPESDLEIRAGEWDTQTKNEILPHQDRFIQRIIVHENYHPGSLRNDFALLYLREPFQLADNVDVVCLPEPNDVFDRSRCWASGWGKDVFGRQIFFLNLIYSFLNYFLNYFRITWRSFGFLILF